MRKIFICSWCWLILLSTISAFSPAQADWYESTASVPINSQGLERARARAVEDALRQSLDFAGGRVSSVEHVVDGVLTGSHFEWTTEGAIEQAHLVRERRNGNRVEVTVRANIRQSNASCAAADFRKGVAVVPFEFAQPDQAREGKVWELERSAAERFAELLGRHSQSLFLQHQLARKVGLNEMRGAQNEQQMAGFARHVSTETDAQFVVGAIFDDISTAQAGPNLTFWTPAAQNRHLGLTLMVFDGASGDLLSRASVRDQSTWDFAKHETVDTNSQHFWQSSYGNLLERALRDLVHGMDQQLACAEPRGQVVRVDGRSVTVNLGDKHGLREGQRLHIYHRGSFVDNQGIYREQWVLSPYQLDVTQVERSSALARISDDQAGSNIQVNDRVTVR